MAAVEVVSATSALPEETTKVDPIKAEETTTNEEVTAPPSEQVEDKEIETLATPEEVVALEPEAPVECTIKEAVVEEVEVAAKEAAIEKKEEESSPKVAPEPVGEEIVETTEFTEAPVGEPEPEPKVEVEAEPKPEPESAAKTPKDEVGAEEGKPAEAEEEVVTEAPVEKTE